MTLHWIWDNKGKLNLSNLFKAAYLFVSGINMFSPPVRMHITS